MPTFIAATADYLTLLDKILSKGLASTKICFDAVRGARRERFVPGCSVFMFAAPTSQWRFDKPTTKQPPEADGTWSAIKTGVWGFLSPPRLQSHTQRAS